MKAPTNFGETVAPKSCLKGKSLSPPGGRRRTPT
eukprot:CAMPEP_0170637710 /NCGR_PEP_ID=MMETSP0224-20130122/38579_1 /TAXON_ID=285029 /ORGANISM="Togula jolla, Strain CCCM 725" /LENGTH=33 /DNA_ID= /DNA_START= /DNA_END= /DNA_ORIENTATION=